jgi:hypothetical protein
MFTPQLLAAIAAELDFCVTYSREELQRIKRAPASDGYTDEDIEGAAQSLRDTEQTLADFIAATQAEGTPVSSTPTLIHGMFAPRDGVTPRIYIDLETSVLTEAEMQNIAEAPGIVRVHEYGAWVHVPPEEAGADPLDADHVDDESTWDDFPNLRAALLFARTMGAYWINFDADGFDTIESLPTFTW